MQTVTATSKGAFFNVREKGADKTQNKRIYKIIKKNGVTTLRQIQKSYKATYKIYLDVGTISARVNYMINELEVLVRSNKPQKCPISKISVHPVFVAK